MVKNNTKKLLVVFHRSEVHIAVPGNCKMFTSQNTSKSKAIFLDVKPAANLNTIQVRRYSDAYETSTTARRDSVVLYGTESRPSLTSAKSIEILEKDVFYYSIYPIVFYLRVIGVLPITRPAPSKAYFSIFTPVFLYSLMVFVLIVVSFFLLK